MPESARRSHGGLQQAIELHPAEAFLYLRRGRHYNSLRACDRALSDFDKAITLAPTSALQGYNLLVELYSLESSVYSGCPDSTRRDPRKAIDACSARSHWTRRAAARVGS